MAGHPPTGLWFVCLHVFLWKANRNNCETSAHGTPPPLSSKGPGEAMSAQKFSRSCEFNVQIVLDCHASCKHFFGMESALGYFETCRMKLPMSFSIRKHNTHGTHCYAMILGQDKKANVFGQILNKQPMLFHVFLDMETL